MSRHLVYVMGPSGVGKDSVLAWVKAHAPAAAGIRFARRTVTRAADAGGEDHEPLTVEAFEQAVQAHAFALHWQANGLHYGIRHGQLAPLKQRQWVLVNGSRGHLPHALAAYPGLTAVHITARPETVRQRLLARGRESTEEVEARLRRARTFVAPPGARCIANDGALADAGRALLRVMQGEQAPSR
ncbi:phosphonate metabolism protein/1,5-bisphosphokinase (PRPP-forming) PhnN [Hydrogenophaga sp. BPS33]|uniref:phosphonate metabolism protein/1,5-bisphosphokinase (PRPP-forming) PhnN n=1 Tax=Hydrogenophaga sp. BPS33 TaxID=2651974 RepID=UPI00131F7597|nr:phosphonate metabolism protein/1,5-bisphosphokinase (PRPP-forming) PhnN [Hydrogenophaga sp. BPS33]QHE83537.1 phosphonate metabolism protein/1,5-bisphosphokinase (PRPP-forming) PhnN [Hydrogenophaga sp. BPS33]